MAWIESHQQMGRHPKTLRLAALLGLPKAQVIGHLHLLWWWALDYSPGGELVGFSACEIESAAEWEGEEGRFLRALQETGWVEPDRRIHDWQDYAGKLLEERALAKDRMRRLRDRQNQRRYGAPRPSPPPSQVAPPAPLAEPAEEWREVLQRHRPFIAAWRDWRQHVADTGRAMSRAQERAVLRECARQSPARAMEVILFSIEKGARNLIWDDAPRRRRPTRAIPPPDPEGWAEWLAETYPEAQVKRFHQAPRDVQLEFTATR